MRRVRQTHGASTTKARGGVSNGGVRNLSSIGAGLPSISTPRSKGMAKAGPLTPTKRTTKPYEVRRLVTGKPRMRFPQKDQDVGRYVRN